MEITNKLKYDNKNTDIDFRISEAQLVVAEKMKRLNTKIHELRLSSRVKWERSKLKRIQKKEFKSDSKLYKEFTEVQTECSLIEIEIKSGRLEIENKESQIDTTNKRISDVESKFLKSEYVDEVFFEKRLHALQDERDKKLKELNELCVDQDRIEYNYRVANKKLNFLKEKLPLD